jgi:hypothetical protein
LRTKTVALETRLSLLEAGEVVDAAFATMKARVETIAAVFDPLGRLGGAADVAVVGRRSMITTAWAVQVYLYELGTWCGVELVALGEGGAVRTLRVPRRTASFRQSVRRMDSLVAELRSHDPRAQLIS